MQDVADLDRYPLDQPQSDGWQALVTRCRAALANDGLFTLPGFLRPQAVAQTAAALAPRIRRDSFRHERRHNIYFKPSVDGLPADHPALAQHTTSNHTLGADQLQGTALSALYDWSAFANFLAAVMDKPALYPMGDPLAGLNVMGYGAGEALNWHFDRSEFTTTLLIQAPDSGGAFEYARDLRRDDDPNHAGVADLLQGRLTPTRMPLDPGGLNVFRGRNTAHRVTPVQGARDRLIAVFSYFDQPGVRFSDAERMGFYGRTE